jgi:methylated-DNA-[protein]-cysteine S-methyltransferase
MNILTWPQTPLGPLWAEVDSQNRLTSLHWGAPPTEATPLASHPAHAILANYFNKQSQKIDFQSLNLKGTPYQQRVWQALLTIPHGQTVTYGQLAEKLGTSPRALGGAVGANPLPILVPCHRVMGQNGKLTGFSAPGGITTKKWLLAHEGVSVA